MRWPADRIQAGFRQFSHGGIEDELDVDRFIKTVDSRKQKELKSLLKYLDGLFEKLPENAIRAFADSEYFDLYVKVMNEIGA